MFAVTGRRAFTPIKAETLKQKIREASCHA